MTKSKSSTASQLISQSQSIAEAKSSPQTNLQNKTTNKKTTTSQTTANQTSTGGWFSRMSPWQKGGCITCSVLGCLWIIAIVGIVIVWGFVWYVRDVNTYSNDNASEDIAVNTNRNTNQAANTNVHRPSDVIISDVPESVDSVEADKNTNDNTNVNLDTTPAETPDLEELETGELVDSEGNSYGFAIEEGFVADDLYAYQIGAYAEDDVVIPEWAAFQFTSAYPKTRPLPENDSGSLWVGAVLDNDYFIQIGMMSTTRVDADGNMVWSYFWEMWDDQDNYLYGLQDDMTYYGWDQNATNIFNMSCVDPEQGTWEFWVNDTMVGRTNTGSCATQVTNSYVFWEMTTTKTDKALLPEFGPFTVGSFEYWDGYDWYPVEHATLSYSFGQVVNGTQVDQANVCPPYGAMALDDTPEKDFRVGSTLSCLEQATQLW